MPASGSSRRETRAAGLARYRQAELLRLQGDFGGAEAAYRDASAFGWEPQPGLAQLRLAQGRTAAAVSAIRRAESAATPAVERARLLPAFVEIMLPAGEIEAARRACVELEQIATGYESAMLGAIVAHARGAVHLAEGEPREALVALRNPRRDVACARRAVRDCAHARADRRRVPPHRGRGGGALEPMPRGSIFERLGAKPDLARSRRRRRVSTGSRAASWRSCGSSPPARRTARSPRRSSSASTRSRGTSRTSSRSSGCPRVRPRRRSRSSTTSSDRRVVRNDHARASRGWWILAMFGDPAVLPSDETTGGQRWQLNRSRR